MLPAQILLRSALTAVALGAQFAVLADAPRRISLEEAVVLALEDNPALAVERLAPRILASEVEQEREIFDTTIVSFFGAENTEGRDLAASGRLFNFGSSSLVTESELTKTFSTGTTLGFTAETEIIDESRDGQQLVESSLGLTVAQPLLRGAYRSANLARVRGARLELRASEHRVRAVAELTASLVEQAYWDHALAARRIALLEQSLGQAEHLLSAIERRVEGGVLARSQVVAAQSEVALRRQDLVDARADREKASLYLRGQLGLGEGSGPVQLDEELPLPAATPETATSHVAHALRARPDLEEARSLARRGQLEVVRAKDGLLPRLDLVLGYRKLGYGDTFSGSWSELGGDRHTLVFGVSLEHFVSNHAARAERLAADATQAQADLAVRNLERIVETEVRIAHVEVARAEAKLAAVAATRELDERKLEVELERFDLGQASSFQVARSQRDLLARRIDEALALAEWHKGLAELYRLDGSLLERRGIAASGALP
jgi:outer membrane protein TolC